MPWVIDPFTQLPHFKESSDSFGVDFLSGIDHIQVGEVLTIPVRKQMIVTDLLLDGDIIINGTLVLI